MKRSLSCTLLILAVALILGIGIWLTTLKPSPAKALMKNHPYEFSDAKEWGKEMQDSYTKDGGCVYISYPKIKQKDTAAIIDQFLSDGKAQFAAMTAEEGEQIPRLIIDYSSEKKEGYIALTLHCALGRYDKEGIEKDSYTQTKHLYLNDKGVTLNIEALLGAENAEKLTILLERADRTTEDLLGYSYDEAQVVLQWDDEERTFTMDEIKRAGLIDPDKPMIAITFDDGPGRLTKDFADLFTKYNGHTTFFMLGSNVNNFQENVKYAYDQGHEIASHTMRHKNLNILSSGSIQAEVDDADQVIANIIGKKPDLVRAPYGNANSTAASIINRPIIHWSLDTEDWRYRDAQSVKAAILNHVADGDIILMHEIYQSTYDGLALAMDELVNRGYQFVSVSELMEYRGITPEVKTYHSFPKD